MGADKHWGDNGTSPGSWNDRFNWVENLSVPAAGDDVHIDDNVNEAQSLNQSFTIHSLTISATTGLYLQADSLQTTERTLTFAGSSPYIKIESNAPLVYFNVAPTVHGTVSLNLASDTEITVSTSHLGSDTGQFHIGGPITGAGGLIKDGPGELCLGAANTYAGATTISGGMIWLDGPGNVGTGPLVLNGGTLTYLDSSNKTLSNSSVTIGASGGAFNVDSGTENLTLTSAIGGSGDMIKAGTGTLTTPGMSSFTGGLTVSGGTLDINGPAPTVTSLSGAGTLTTSSATTRTLTINNSADCEFAGVISGKLALTKSGTGVLTLSGSNTYTGGTTISAGVVSITANSNLGDGTAPLTLNGGTLRTTGSLYLSSDNNDRPVILGASGGTFDIPDESSDLFIFSDISGGKLSKTGLGDLHLYGSSTLSEVHVDAGTLSVPDSSSIQDTATVYLGTDASHGTLWLGGGKGTWMTALGAGGGTIVSPHGRVFGVISDAGTGQHAGLEIDGPGTVTLGGHNTYTGDTLLPADARLAVANSTAQYSALGASTLIAQGGYLTSDGLTSQIITNAVVVQTGLTLTGTGNLTLAGPVTLDGPIGIDSTSPTFTITGQISGPGAIVFTSGSFRPTLHLTNSGNSFTGSVTVSGNGILVVAANGALGSTSGGTTVNSSATLAFAAVGSPAGNVIYASPEPVTLSGGTIQSDGINSFAGPITLSAINSTVNVHSGSFTLSGNIGEAQGISRSLRQTGDPGTLILSGANTFSGGFSLLGGTLALGADSDPALAFGPVGKGTLTIASGQVSSSDSSTRTLHNPLSVTTNLCTTGSGNLVFNGAVAFASLAPSVIVGNPSTKLAGALSWPTGAASLTKGGTGELVLTSALSKSDLAVALAGGTLTLAGSQTIGPITGGSTLTNAQGQAYSGTLKVGDGVSTVTVSTGVIMVGSLTVNANATAVVRNGPAILNLQGLALNGSGSSEAGLDLGNNSMVLYYSGSSPLATIRQYAADAQTSPGHGLWTSDGDNPSVSPFGRTLAIFDNANTQFRIFGGITLFSTAADYNQILIKYTYYGDANLDGMVSTEDYAYVDGYIGLDHDWMQGDLNGDGNTTPADYAQIDGNIGAGNGSSGGPQLAVAAVPEPGSIGLGAICASLLIRRRIGNRKPASAGS